MVNVAGDGHDRLVRGSEKGLALFPSLPSNHRHGSLSVRNLKLKTKTKRMRDGYPFFVHAVRSIRGVCITLARPFTRSSAIPDELHAPKSLADVAGHSEMGVESPHEFPSPYSLLSLFYYLAIPRALLWLGVTL